MKTEKGFVISTSKLLGNVIIVEFSDVKSFFNCFKYGVKGLFDFAKKKEVQIPIPIVMVNNNNEVSGLAYYLSYDGKVCNTKPCWFNYFRVYKDMFSRVKDKDEIDYLRKRKIGIIGLGALGSVIARS